MLAALSEPLETVSDYSRSRKNYKSVLMAHSGDLQKEYKADAEALLELKVPIIFRQQAALNGLWLHER